MSSTSTVVIRHAEDLIYSPIYQRLLLGHGPLSEHYGEQVVDAVFDGLASS